jgi:endonuclease YncB( thermonuclease family)
MVAEGAGTASGARPAAVAGSGAASAVGLLSATTAAPAAAAGPIVGQASVVDADTIEIHGQRIRLAGIDAPESDQLCRDADSNHYRCGQTAANALFDFINHRPVQCIEVDRDRYGRSVAVCTVAGVDLADWLVRAGLALDWPRYSKGDYAAPQAEAERAGKGMWAGSFVKPWDYRPCTKNGGRLEWCSDEGLSEPPK